jgi:uncharacterized membrane protein YvbJ
VTCRNCGAEIADKALICYRCGTATTEAKYQPAKPGGGRSRWSLIWIVLAILALAALALLIAGAHFFRPG